MSLMRVLSIGLLTLMSVVDFGEESRFEVADHCGPDRHVCSSCGVRG